VATAVALPTQCNKSIISEYMHWNYLMLSNLAQDNPPQKWDFSGINQANPLEYSCMSVMGSPP